MNKNIEKNLQKEVNNLVIDNEVQIYISTKDMEKETYCKFEKAFGLLKVELGKNKKILFKIDDLKQIIGDEK